MREIVTDPPAVRLYKVRTDTCRAPAGTWARS